MKKLHAKHFLMYFLFMGSLFSLLGCSDEDYEVSIPKGSRELTLFYQQQADVEVITRGTQTNDEIRINNLYSIFYKYDASTEANRIFQGVSVNAINDNNEAGTVTIKLPGTLNASDKYYVYFLANPEGYLELNGSADVKARLEAALSSITYSQAVNELEGIAPSSPITTPGLPMFGKTTKDTNSNTVGVLLTRTVSRIDLFVDQTVLPHSDFELEEVTIRNAREYTKLLSGSSVDLRQNTFKQYISDKFTPTSVGNVDQIVGEMYTFPNYQAASSKGDGETTCLIIRGKYNGGASSYYRLNVKPTTGSQTLKPNHLYKIRITGVTGAGAKDEDGAYQETDGKLSYEIDDWKQGDMGDGSSDANGNKLDVSPRQVVFSYLKDQTTSVNILKTLKDVSNNPGAMTITSSDPTNFDIINQTATSFEIKVLTDNYGNTDREAHVMVEWGTMKVPVYITQLGATSTAGGMRVAPSSLPFGLNGGSSKGSLLITGNLDGVDVSKISYQVMKTENDLDPGIVWCKLREVSSGVYFTEVSKGLYEFTVETTAMASTATYSRSAVIYFSMTKDNGEVLNATMSVRQSPGGGTNPGSKVALHLWEWSTNTPPSSYPAANVTTGYNNNGVWGVNTSIFQGFPSDKVGSHQLHFSIVEHKTIKYQMSVPMSQSWRILVKGEAVGRISFTATTSASVASDGIVWIMATEDPVAPWTGGSFVIEYADGTQDEFFVHQGGVVSRLNGATVASFNDKIYYYGTMVMNNRVWLDRNLGATSNGFFSNQGKNVTGVDNDPNAKGAYLNYNNATKACPAGFRLPKYTANGSDGEMGFAYNNSYYSGTTGVMAGGKTYKNTWYVGIDSDPSYWLIPLCGYEGSESYQGGCYWYQGGYVHFSNGGSKDLNANTATNGFSVRCIRDK